MNTSSLSDRLRGIIDDAGLSKYYIAKLAGIPDSALSRFMAGKDVSTKTFDKIADALCVTITVDTRKLDVLRDAMPGLGRKRGAS